MKKMLKFGARKRYNGEDESLVSDAPVARRLPIGPGVTKEQTDEAYDNMRRRAKELSEGVAAKAEGERSASEDREKIMGGTRPSSFREAFAEARKAGKDKFTFNGKSYTTEMAGAKPTASKPAESKPAAKTESASIEVKASRLPSPNKPREASGILSSLKEGVTRGGYEFGQEKESSKRSTSEKKPKSTERPEGFLSSFSKAMTSGGREFTGSGHEFGKKHGGKVHKYAKGGKVGSASKRADGIAMRGKTRGMMR